MNIFPLFQIEVAPPARPSSAMPRHCVPAQVLSESLEEAEQDLKDPLYPDFQPMGIDYDPDSDSDYPEHDEDENDLEDSHKKHFDIINTQNSLSTVKKTGRDILCFQAYLQEQGESRAFETIPPKRLDPLLSSYISTLRKLDGGEYEPSTITGIMGSIDRYLRESDYEVNIQRSPLFKSAQETGKAKKAFLKSLGKGNCPNKAQALTEQEIEILWTKNGFNYDDPDCLLAAIWFLLALNFGLKGSHECRQLTVGDLTVREHSNGQSYLELNEMVTKTRKGNRNGRAFAPKAWSNGTPRCPVFIYEQFMSRRPAHMSHADCPFFLNVNRQRKAENPIWFSAKPMGRNFLGAILRTAATRAGIDRPGLSNHTVRATSISRLLNAGIDPVIVAQHSGHKDPNSIRHYATADLEAQPEPIVVPVTAACLAHTQIPHNMQTVEPEATCSSIFKCRAPPTTPAGMMSGLTHLHAAERHPVSAALGRAPSPLPEDTEGKKEVYIFVYQSLFCKYLNNGYAWCILVTITQVDL